MRSRAPFCLLLTAALCFAGDAAFAGSGAAPADAYFGPFKMTPLQIRLKIGALGRAYHARSSSDHDILHDAELAESALRVWRDAYPRDVWLAPTAFHLEQLYQAVQTAEARERATAMLHYVATLWPKTTYGRDARQRLRAGFAALHPESPLRPTPNPYAKPAASPQRLPPTTSPTRPAGSSPLPASPTGAATPTPTPQIKNPPLS